MDLMTDTYTLSCDAFPVEGGHLVVPASLPFYVPNEALPLPVGEWLRLEPSETVGAS
jgi:hypothetical protein